MTTPGQAVVYFFHLLMGLWTLLFPYSHPDSKRMIKYVGNGETSTSFRFKTGYMIQQWWTLAWQLFVCGSVYAPMTGLVSTRSASQSTFSLTSEFVVLIVWAGHAVAFPVSALHAFASCIGPVQMFNTVLHWASAFIIFAAVILSRWIDGQTLAITAPIIAFTGAVLVYAVVFLTGWIPRLVCDMCGTRRMTDTFFSASLSSVFTIWYWRYGWKDRLDVQHEQYVTPLAIVVVVTAIRVVLGMFGVVEKLNKCAGKSVDGCWRVFNSRAKNANAKGTKAQSKQHAGTNASALRLYLQRPPSPDPVSSQTSIPLTRTTGRGDDESTETTRLLDRTHADSDTAAYQQPEAMLPTPPTQPVSKRTRRGLVLTPG